MLMGEIMRILKCSKRNVPYMMTLSSNSDEVLGPAIRTTAIAKSSRFHEFCEYKTTNNQMRLRM